MSGTDIKGDWRVDITFRDNRRGVNLQQSYYKQHCTDNEALSHARARFAEEFPRSDQWTYLASKAVRDEPGLFW